MRKSLMKCLKGNKRTIIGGISHWENTISWQSLMCKWETKFSSLLCLRWLKMSSPMKFIKHASFLLIASCLYSSWFRRLLMAIRLVISPSSLHIFPGNNSATIIISAAESGLFALLTSYNFIRNTNLATLSNSRHNKTQKFAMISSLAREVRQTISTGCTSRIYCNL